MIFFWCKFGFGKCLGVSCWSSPWAGFRQLSIEPTFHHMSQSDQETARCCIELRQHFKTTCFLRGWVSSWDTHLSSSFTFPACFSCWMTIELLTLSSSAVSHVVTRGCASMILPIVIVKLRWAATALLIFKAHVSLKVEVQNFLNLHCTICLLAVPRWSAFLMLWVVSAALQPILNSNKKSCSNLLFV